MPPTNSPQSPRTPPPPAVPIPIIGAAGAISGNIASSLHHDVQRPLTPLSYLSSPVTDLAATLRTMPPEEHSQSRQEAQTSGQSTASSHGFSSRISATDSENRERRQRLHRVMASMYRSANAAGLAAPSSASAYGNRTPSPGRQDLYDWAPSASQQQDANRLDREVRRTQTDESFGDLGNILAEARVRQLTRPRGVINSNNASSPGPSSLIERREERLGQIRDYTGTSLRNRAVLQRHREQTQSLIAELSSGESAASRAGVEYREQSNMSEEEERARELGWIDSVFRSAIAAEPPRSATPLSSGRDSWPLPPPRDESSHSQTSRENAIHQRSTAETISRHSRISTLATLTRPYLDASPVVPSPFLEKSLKYLDRLRSCDTYEDALGAAIDHGMATREFFAERHEDFIMDLREIESFTQTSWLQPGTVFSGHQHGASALNPAPAAATTFSVEQINPHHRPAQDLTFNPPPGSIRVTHNGGSVTRSQISQHLPSHDAGRQPPYLAPSDHLPHDRWPVRVIIHAVDYEKMLLQGTMEAYDVPQNSNPGILCNTNLGVSTSGHNAYDRRLRVGKKSAPVRTYLEGHIIDLRTHSFLTPPIAKSSASSHETATGNIAHSNGCPSLKLNDEIPFPAATSAADAANWRELPPFSSAASSLPTPSSIPSACSAEDNIARMLLSKAKLHRIHNEYIFMRWKERCFLHDDPPTSAPAASDTSHALSGNNDTTAALTRLHSSELRTSNAREKCPGSHVHGLTISGFYYISLRRSDGRIEGLYFDPHSTPHQQLHLEAVNGARMGWASCELR